MKNLAIIGRKWLWVNRVHSQAVFIWMHARLQCNYAGHWVCTLQQQCIGTREVLLAHAQHCVITLSDVTSQLTSSTVWGDHGP